mgnify:CR=1 FL=1
MGKGSSSGKSSGGCGTIIFIFCIIYICLKACSSDSAIKSPQYNDAYWRSIEREKTMRDAGLDDFADREKRERRNKLKESGSSTYNGSQKQKDDLKEIDEYMKNHPNF